MQKKKSRKGFLFLRYLYLNWWRYIVSIQLIMLVIGSQCVNKQL